MMLTDYRTLGRSGLVVSPLALGTMTFGTARWGADDDASAAIFDAYVEAGGNFIDSADVYAKGRSEEIVGRLIAERGLRDRLVLATKFGFSAEAGNPNAGGNGRKNIHRALDGSLRRLRTDAIDLYWLHVYDSITPVEEVLQSMGDLVRAGKVRYYGLSDVPAWYAAKMSALASAHAVPGPIAMQLEYSLVERSIEREHLPAARDAGLGVCPWSPLAGGFLAGKYTKDADGATGEGRLSGPNPFQKSKFTGRNWRILDTLKSVAAESGRPESQVALAWVADRPGIGSTLIGASRVEQVRDNLAALDLALSPDHRKALDDATAPEPCFPYGIFTPEVGRMIFGARVEGWR